VFEHTPSPAKFLRYSKKATGSCYAFRLAVVHFLLFSFNQCYHLCYEGAKIGKINFYHCESEICITLAEENNIIH
jgi:hypothetical protein